MKHSNPSPKTYLQIKIILATFAFLIYLSVSMSGCTKNEDLPKEILYNIDSTAFTDIRDNNIYPIIQIGNQRWMAENLRYNASGSWLSSLPQYGRLYAWDVMMNGASSSNSIPSNVQGICPRGWHVPSDEEWEILEIAIGIDSTSANGTGWRGSDHATKLKSTTGWSVTTGLYTNGSNSSGFNAYPAGVFSGTVHLGEGLIASFWTSRSMSTHPNTGFFRQVHSGKGKIFRGAEFGTQKCACRCVED